MSGLAVQNLESLDVSKLTPLTPEVISRQATINIGTIGHVAHGKSTVVKAISGVQTVRFKNELERNITIKLGYANAKIYKCSGERPGCYRSYSSNKEDSPLCECGHGHMQLLRHVSFVDCFGIDTEFLLANGSPISIAEIKVGDLLMGPDGAPRAVQSIVEGSKPLFKVQYLNQSGVESDGFLCTGGHILCLRIDSPVDTPAVCEATNQYFVRVFHSNSNGTTCSSKLMFDSAESAWAYYNSADRSPVQFELTVEAYLAAPEFIRSKARLYRAAEMKFDESSLVDLEIGNASESEVGWLIGEWLGSGHESEEQEIKFTCHAEKDEAIIEKIEDVAAKMGLVATKQKAESDRNAYSITLSGNSSSETTNSFHQLLSKLGMIKTTKHIPSQLKLHRVAVREAIVAGLIDAQGSQVSGQVEIDLKSSSSSSSSLLLSQDLATVVRSLGYTAQIISTPNTSEKTRIRFTGPTISRLPTTQKPIPTPRAQRIPSTSLQFSVSKAHENAAFRGFQVQGDGQIVLRDMTVVHNCPGHDILMATMLNGAAVMDAALLLVAGNESCPQPQTAEHLAAVEIMKLKHLIILQNKIDLVKEPAAAQQYEDIKAFVAGTAAEGAPIIPISAQLRYNIDVICEYIVKTIPIPVRDFSSSPRLIVIRSFDVNKPGEDAEDVKGGVAGGSILQGVLRRGMEIEIRPGIVSKDEQGNVKCVPIFSRILNLFSEQNELEYAVPGGLIGVGTKIDPTLTRSDRLVGQVLGEVGSLPSIFTDLEINYYLLRRLLGVKTEGEKGDRVSKLTKGEILMVNVGSTSTGGRVFAVKNDLAKIQLTTPVCTQVDEKIALSRRVDKHWRLIGWGQVRRGTSIQPSSA